MIKVINESSENMEVEFAYFHPHVGMRKCSKDKAIQMVENFLNDMKNGSGYDIAGRGFAIYCTQSPDKDGQMIYGRNDPDEFLSSLKESKITESRSIEDDFKEIKSKYNAVTRLGTTVIDGDKYDEISKDLLSKGYTKGSRKSWSTGTGTDYLSDNGIITVGVDNVPDYDHRDGRVRGSSQQTIISMSKTVECEWIVTYVYRNSDLNCETHIIASTEKEARLKAKKKLGRSAYRITGAYKVR